MGWAIGYDTHWKRDIGYGVPAFCDYPGCGAFIDRGLAYVCGGEPRGGERGCGLYFCGKHLLLPLRGASQLCERCVKRRKPFTPTPDSVTWLHFKMTDPSWRGWREERISAEEMLRSGTRDA